MTEYKIVEYNAGPTVIPSKRGDCIMIEDVEGIVEAFRWMSSFKHDPNYKDMLSYLARCGVVYKDAEGNCPVQCSPDAFFDGCQADCDRADVGEELFGVGKKVVGRMETDKEGFHLDILEEGDTFKGWTVKFSGFPPYVDEDYAGRKVEASLVDGHAFFRRFVKEG